MFHTHSQSITYCMLNEEVHLIRNNQHFKYFFNKAHVTATQQVSPATSICMCSCRGAATVTRKGPQQLPYACLVFADSLSVLAIWTLCGSKESYACTCKLFFFFLIQMLYMVWILLLNLYLLTCAHSNGMLHIINECLCFTDNSCVMALMFY